VSNPPDHARRARRLDLWASRFAEMQERRYNGRALRDNPELVAAIEEIRDGYYEIFKRMARVQRENTRRSTVEGSRYMNDLHCDMVGYGHDCYLRLQQEHHISESDAAALMGSVINRACTSFNDAGVKYGAGAYVPKKDLAKTPAEIGWSRLNVTQDDAPGDKGKIR